MTGTPFDVDRLMAIPSLWRAGSLTLKTLFEQCDASSVTDGELAVAVAAALHAEPSLIADWQQYSYDKRSSPSPYLDGLEVGHYDAGYRFVRRHGTTAQACVDFIVTEVRWVTERRVVGAG